MILDMLTIWDQNFGLQTFPAGSVYCLARKIRISSRTFANPSTDPGNEAKYVCEVKSVGECKASVIELVNEELKEDKEDGHAERPVRGPHAGARKYCVAT